MIDLILTALVAFVAASVAWGFYTDWQTEQSDQKRINEKLALREQYLTLAKESPSAWEGYGDALRQSGYLPEAMEAYETALQMRAGVAPPPLPFETQYRTDSEPDEPPLPELESDISPEPLPLAAPPDLSITPTTDTVVLMPVGTMLLTEDSEETTEDGSHSGTNAPSGTMLALSLPEEEIHEIAMPRLSLVPTGTGDDAEQALAIPQEEEDALAMAPVAAPRTAPVISNALDHTGGTGLETKLRLTRLELEQMQDPEQFGQTLRTRQPVCRICGNLAGSNDRDCPFCGAPLPVNTLLETMQHQVIRHEILRGGMWVGIHLGIVGICIWLVGWLPPLAKISVIIASVIVIPLRLLQKIGDR
ncbi:MAG: hypothetical protein OHK0029_39370 [Armatimonadaceae bacterium]